MAKATCIEIATMDLKPDTSIEQFTKVDAAIEREHVSQQPGFVARETAHSAHKWLVIVHWETEAHAQASMDSFASAPAAAEFMDLMDSSTMQMTRYTKT